MMDRSKMVCINGLWVPQNPAVKVGLGCPKCDQADIVPVNQRDHDLTKICLQFQREHRACGRIETIEVQMHGGKECMIVTGFLPSPAVLRS